MTHAGADGEGSGRPEASVPRRCASAPTSSTWPHRPAAAYRCGERVRRLGIRGCLWAALSGPARCARCSRRPVGSRKAFQPPLGSGSDRGFWRDSVLPGATRFLVPATGTAPGDPCPLGQGTATATASTAPSRFAYPPASRRSRRRRPERRSSCRSAVAPSGRVCRQDGAKGTPCTYPSATTR